jgi:hypothetical protein
MKNIFEKLRDKITGSSGMSLIFYKLLFILLKWIIILTRGSGFSFPLIFQTTGTKSVTYSYGDFKDYQRKVRFIFLAILILVLVFLKIY